MFSSQVEHVLEREGCLELDELTQRLRSSYDIQEDDVVKLPQALQALGVFEACCRNPMAWTLVGHCPHEQCITATRISSSLLPPPPHKWQSRALETWIQAGYRGIMEAVTGSGKTMVAIYAIQLAFAKPCTVLVVVPTAELQHQWLVLLRRYFSATALITGDIRSGYDNLSARRIIVSIVNSARSLQISRHGHGDLIIADEVHKYASPINARVLDENFDFRLGLSATVSRPDGGHHQYLAPYFGSVILNYSHADAARDGVIAPFHLRTLSVPMSDNESSAYIELDDAVRQHLIRFKRCYGRPFSPDQFLEILIHASQGKLNHVHPDLEYIAKALQFALLERRGFLDSLESKIVAAGDLIKQLDTAHGCLVFTQSISTAQRMAEYLLQQGVKAAAVHSQLSRSLREAQITRLRKGEIVVLVAPRILDEGVDLPSVDTALILTASGSERQMIQRLGRILRRKPGAASSTLLVLFAAGTVEDPSRGTLETLMSALRDAAASYEQINSPIRTIG